jgi:hypothetical protein
MASLFLHVGHPKTGSSWIQSCLRSSRAGLGEQGIRYAEGADANVSDPLRITSGNAAGILHSEAAFEQALARNPCATERGLLFSSEWFPSDFLAAQAHTFLEAVAERHGFDDIRVLLFIRNPVSLAVSSWIQLSKRRGKHDETLDEFCRNPDAYSKHITQARQFCRQLASCPRVILTVRNYSYCAGTLIDEVADWLGVPADLFAGVPRHTVNRALTWSELRLQRALNVHLGRAGHVLSDPLCERLPDITPERLAPSPEIQSAMASYLAPVLAEMNAQIPEAHRYHFDLTVGDPLPEALVFTEEQNEVIAAGLGGEIRRLRDELEVAQQRIASLQGANASLRARLPPPPLLRRLGSRMKRFLSRR